MIAFLDACAVIYWVEMKEPLYDQFVQKLRRMQSQYQEIIFAVSHLSVLECQVKPLRDKNKDIMQRYERFFKAKDLLLVPMGLTVIKEATLLRAKYNLATPDALQAASASSVSDELIFVTGDAVFKKIPQLNVMLV